MEIAAALSQEHDARGAATEAGLQARRALGDDRPDLAFVFASSHFVPQAEALLDALHTAAEPRSLVGCVSQGIVGGPTEVEDGPAVSVWLARLSDGVETFHTSITEELGEMHGWPKGDHHAYVVFCDPYTFPPEKLLSRVNEQRRGSVVVGGLASGGAGPGHNRLFIDDAVVFSGAVGVALSGGVEVRTLVSQGCRPVGRTFTVTRSEGNVIFELGGQTGVERIRELYATLPEEERQLVAQGLLIGRVIDEYKTEFERGDFLIRSVMGADPQSGAIAVGEVVDVGQTVQFHVRDAASADEDLRERVGRAKGLGRGRSPVGALLFTCNGRGLNMFPAPHHDASLISEEFEGLPLAGFFCAGELGPVGGQSFVHGFTASMALFYEGDKTA